jgi:hypothetical protein
MRGTFPLSRFFPQHMVGFFKQDSHLVQQVLADARIEIEVFLVPPGYFLKSPLPLSKSRSGNLGTLTRHLQPRASHCL